ncbi:MAG: hypothetical protein J0H43_10015, partial [Actinobacteria bacterium]|nr:hypothetical protein [Actinomycetota bacterium]
MHVVVLVKQVPHHDQTPRLDEDGRLIRDGVPTELNPFCRRAVAQAVRLARLSGGTCTAVTMGPDGAADVLREARACGVDHAVHVSDPALAGADCLATARALAAALGTLAPADLILTGRSSIDADTAVVGPMVAALLDRPFAGPALRIEPTGPGTALALTLQHDDATEEVEVSLPAVVAVAERSIAPAKAAPHEWPAPDGIGRIDTATLGEGPWGERGSGTVVHTVRAEARTRTPRRLAGPPEQQAVRAVDLLRERGARAADDPAVAPARPVPADLDGPAVLTLLDATRTPRARYALLDAAAGLAARVGGHVVAAGWPDDPITLREHGADAMLTWESGDARPLCAALAPAAARAWAVLA